MQHLWSAWRQIEERIRSAEHVLLLSDFDGTLSAIAARPELALLPAETEQLLRNLSRRCDITVVVISGRALDDIKSRVNIPGITYAGNHGLEIEGPSIRFVNPLAQQTAPLIRRLCDGLSQALSGIEGVVIEEKGLTLSVHYRLVEERRVGELMHLFEEVIGGAGSDGCIRVTHGKKVLEVRPAVDWDKGKAADLLMNLCGDANPFPIFIGDDVTDEDGFALVNQRRGISILVGVLTTKSSAGYAVETPSEVSDFLSRLLGISIGR